MYELNPDEARERARIIEHNERQRRKEEGEREYQRRKALGRTVTDSADPEHGLQPAVGSHDAWPYRHGPVTVSKTTPPPPYVDQKKRDLAAERRETEGERFTPRCTGCLARLDPQWCGNLAPDDRDAR